MHIKRIPTVLAAILAVFLFLPVSASAATIYGTDQGHTEVLFGWKHAGVSMQHAEFTQAQGTLVLEDDIERSSVSVVIQADSLSSGFDALDRDLKSSNFLDVAKHPEIKFESTSVSKTGDKTFDVAGNLTLHGVTQPVVLKATMTHLGPHPVAKFFDYYKGDWIAFHASTTIDHMAFKVGSFSTGPISVEINTEMKAK
jgi:polyisoprenoid-binding protein YceI